MISIPEEFEQQLRAIAAHEQRDVQEVAKDLIRDGLKAAAKRAFDRELRQNIAAGLAGDVVSEEELFASLGDE
jgi:hypothetical protein